MARLAVHGKLPKVALGVEVEEAYLHYSKVFLRNIDYRWGLKEGSDKTGHVADCFELLFDPAAQCLAVLQRDKFLDVNLFSTLRDATVVIERWRRA